jgi:long-chain acyl-CoA synthetase
MNIAKHLERSAIFFPARPAVCELGREISYRDLNRQAGRIASALTARGVQPGDLIGLCAPNSTQWLALYFGVLKTGAVAATFSPLLPAEELVRLMRHARPRFVHAAPDKLGPLGDLIAEGAIEGLIASPGDFPMDDLPEEGTAACRALDRNPSDTAAVLFTGGTTGIPKGVLLSHENITVSSHNVAYSERSTEKDRALCFLPFNHVFGQMHIMNATIMTGGCLELLPAFDLDAVLETLGSGRVTKFYGVPTIYIRLLGLDRLAQRLGHVRYCFSAAASLAAEIVREWKTATALDIHEGYGLTETASAVTYNHYLRHRVGSIGEAVPGIEVEIRDFEGQPLGLGREGEICIRGRNVMNGYLNNEEETAAAFWPKRWFRSGDIGVLDEDGYLCIVDRLKDMIISGGENVYPREVEEVLYTRHEIQECAVIGLPDKEWGEQVTAFIVPKPGFSLRPEELKSYLKSRLAPFKVPKKFIVVEGFPKSAAGKILKREMKQQMSAEGAPGRCQTLS